MLHFLNPIWLMAGSGILIPVIIHLWNTRKGKVLRIGSISLMNEATQKSASKLRITQWLLLILRCLLIIILSGLLANPQWQRPRETSAKGWVLVEKTRLAPIYQEYRDTIDALLNSGYELREFGGEFGIKKSIGTYLQDSITETSGMPYSQDTITELTSYWNRISELDRQLPAGFPVHIFSGSARYGSGADSSQSGFLQRPTVSIDLSWSILNAGQKQAATDLPQAPALSSESNLPQPTASASSIDSSPAPIPLNLRRLSNGSYQLASLVSTPGGNYFTKTAVTADGPASSPAITALFTDTSEQKITIYNNNHREDAKYLEAAINAISSFGKYKIKLTNTQKKIEIPSMQDWIFWLSEEALPDDPGAGNYFVYQAGKPVAIRSWIAFEDGPVSGDAIKIYKRVDADSIPGNRVTKVLWKDGFGDPLLSVETGTRNIFHFFSRFDPAWSDLTWSAAFPKLLFPILIADPVKDRVGIYDMRLVPGEQVMPSVAKSTYKDDKAAFELFPLDKIFWMVAFILFVTERFLSLKRQNNKTA